jgi:hypothetical protein
MSFDTWVSLSVLLAAFTGLYLAMRSQFAELKADIAGLRAELKADIAGVGERVGRLEDRTYDLGRALPAPTPGPDRGAG